jgi:hypothetical protein
MTRLTCGIERKVTACSPTAQHMQRYKEVMTELQKRRTAAAVLERRKEDSKGLGGSKRPIDFDDES